MPHRPLVLVTGLTVVDYMLWNWSAGGDHGVLALVSGLTLPPLAVMCVGLLVLSLFRLAVSGSSGAPSGRQPTPPARARRRVRTVLTVLRRRRVATAHGIALAERPQSSTVTATGSSGKLAA